MFALAIIALLVSLISLALVVSAMTNINRAIRAQRQVNQQQITLNGENIKLFNSIERRLRSHWQLMGVHGLHDDREPREPMIM